MKTLLFRAVALVMALFMFAAPVHAGWPTTIVANIPDIIKWVANEVPQWRQQLQEAQQMVRAAQTVRDFAGDPKGAVKRLSDVSGILDTIGRMTGDEEYFALAKEIRTVDDAMQQADMFQRELEQTIEIAGQPRRRNVTAYEATLALERIYNTTRKYTKNERDAQKKIGAKIDESNKRIDEIIANPNGASQSDILAQLLQQQRLANLLAIEAAKRANAQAEAEALARSRAEQKKAEERAVAEKDALTESEGGRLAAEKLAAEKARIQKENFKTVPAAEWEVDKMFGRRIRTDIMAAGPTTKKE